MRYFPLYMDTRDKKVLVCGGGRSAQLKIEGLLSSEFHFYCIAETFSPAITALQKKYPERISLKARHLDEDFVFFAYDYVIVATDDHAVNAALIRRAKCLSVPVLSTENREDSDFRLAYRIEHGPLSVSVSCQNPTISRKIGEALRPHIEQFDAEKLSLLNRIRACMRRKGQKNISEVMEDLWTNESIQARKFLEEIDETTPGHKGQPIGAQTSTEHSEDL